MADEKDTKEAKAAERAKAKEAEAKAAADAAAANEEAASQIERDRLIWQSTEFFGVSPAVVAGALAGLDGRRETFTVDEVKAQIEKFMNSPAEPAQED